MPAQTLGEKNMQRLAEAQKKDAARIVTREIAPVPSSAFSTPAVRPHNSRLDSSRLQSVFGLTLPPWQQGVDRMLAEIL